MTTNANKNIQVGARLTQDENERLSTVLAQLSDNPSSLTFREQLLAMLKTLEGSSQNESSLTSENDRLQAEINSLTKQLEDIPSITVDNPELSNRISGLETEKERLQVELDQANGKLEGISENNQVKGLSIPIDKQTFYFLEHLAKIESKRTGKLVAPQDIIYHHFWETLDNGPGDYLPYVFSRGEIRSLLSKIKEDGSDQDD